MPTLIISKAALYNPSNQLVNAGLEHAGSSLKAHADAALKPHRREFPVYINSNGQLGTQTSSIRFKEQIHSMGDSSSALMKLRPRHLPLQTRVRQRTADPLVRVDR